MPRLPGLFGADWAHDPGQQQTVTFKAMRAPMSSGISAREDAAYKLESHIGRRITYAPKLTEEQRAGLERDRKRIDRLILHKLPENERQLLRKLLGGE